MSKSIEKLRRRQVQERLNEYVPLLSKPIPKNGWIRTVREALGISLRSFAKILECSPANLSNLEKRELTGSITLKKLDEIARAMNCKVVYSLVPMKPLQDILKERAHKIAKKRIEVINHSMNLEEQGLSEKKLREQEDDLVELLLQNPKQLWENDDF